MLAGDTHNAWKSILKDVHGNRMGVELAASSVSTTGMAKYLNIPI